MYRSILCIVVMCIPFPLAAHQDTTLKLESDGRLVGLPQEYLPANLDISSWTISIVKQQFTFPRCLSSRLKGVKESDIEISSSWYNPVHVVSEDEYFSFPSYLKIEIESKDFVALFKLDNAKPFDTTHPEYKEIDDVDVCSHFVDDLS